MREKERSPCVQCDRAREKERSPCVQCDRATRNKNECATSCEKLEMYQQRLPYFSLWRGDCSEYVIPGLQRTPCYRIYE
jgi:hypothetical protein